MREWRAPAAGEAVCAAGPAELGDHLSNFTLSEMDAGTDGGGRVSAKEMQTLRVRASSPCGGGQWGRAVGDKCCTERDLSSGEERGRRRGEGTGISYLNTGYRRLPKLGPGSKDPGE